MSAVITQTAGDKPVKVPLQIGGMATNVDCLAYFLWIEKWLRIHGENRIADDFAEALREGETLALAA